jgi:hypothetical protein
MPEKMSIAGGDEPVYSSSGGGGTAVQTDPFHSTSWLAPFLVRANEKPGLSKDALFVL